MELIEDLGMIMQRSGRKVRFGMYKCPSCLEVKRFNTWDVNAGQKGCASCRKTTHGKSKTKIYSTWSGMKARCYYKQSKEYMHYGGRGITVCDEWRDNFTSFMEWAYKNGYTDGRETSIDRIDNDGDYEPSNCRFTTANIQVQNTRLLRKTNSSGYRGVNFHKGSNKWRARIQVNSVPIHIGAFDNAIDAAIAYDNYVIENKLSHTINKIKGK